MTPTIETRTYTIPAGREFSARRKLDKLFRKAAKLGLGELTAEFSEPFKRPLPDDHPHNRYGDAWELVVNVTLPVGAVKLSGWRLTHKLDHKSAAPAVLIDSAPGEASEATDWRNAGPHCAHCKHKRMRNTTYVCEHNDGRIMQIGSTCLKDFLGHNPAACLSWVEKLRSEWDEWMDYGPGPDLTWSFETILRACYAEVAIGGWLSRSEAEMRQRQSTGEAVRNYLLDRNPCPSPSEVKHREAMHEHMKEQRATEHVLATMGWVEHSEGRSDYEHNLKALLAAVHVPAARIPLVASALISWRRWKGLTVLGALEDSGDMPPPIDEHLANVKDKVEIEVFVTRTRELESQWGLTTLVGMRSLTGHELVWFASGRKEFEPGDRYKVKGTVKRHERYQDRAQTSLTRCKLTKVETTQAA